MTTNIGIEYYKGSSNEYRCTLWNRFDLFVPSDIKGIRFLKVVRSHNIVAGYLSRHPEEASIFDMSKNGTSQYFEILSKASSIDLDDDSEAV